MKLCKKKISYFKLTVGAVFTFATKMYIKTVITKLYLTVILL